MFVLMHLLLILHLISLSMGKWGEWVSGHLYLTEHKEILAICVTYGIFWSVGFAVFKEGSVILLTVETY